MRKMYAFAPELTSKVLSGLFRQNSRNRHEIKKNVKYALRDHSLWKKLEEQAKKASFAYLEIISHNKERFDTAVFSTSPFSFAARNSQK